MSDIIVSIQLISLTSREFDDSFIQDTLNKGLFLVSIQLISLTSRENPRTQTRNNYLQKTVSNQLISLTSRELKSWCSDVRKSSVSIIVSNQLISLTSREAPGIRSAN